MSDDRRSVPRQRLSLGLLLCVLPLLAACQGTLPIRKLLADPGEYNGKTVRIEGTVKGSVGALGQGAYRVDDGTGSISVVSQGAGVPTDGARVKVKGEFRSLFQIGSQSASVILEQERDAQ